MNWLLTTIFYGLIALFCLAIIGFIAWFPICIVCFCAMIVTMLILGLIVRGCIAICNPWPWWSSTRDFDPDVIPFTNLRRPK